MAADLSKRQTTRAATDAQILKAVRRQLAELAQEKHLASFGIYLDGLDELLDSGKIPAMPAAFVAPLGGKWAGGTMRSKQRTLRFSVVVLKKDAGGSEHLVVGGSDPESRPGIFHISDRVLARLMDKTLGLEIKAILPVSDRAGLVGGDTGLAYNEMVFETSYTVTEGAAVFGDLETIASGFYTTENYEEDPDLELTVDLTES